ncbi:MAG: hypothetical protein AB1422_15660 [bacterium]
MEISSTGTDEIRLGAPMQSMGRVATSLPESRTPSPESRFSEEPFSLQPNYGHGKRTRFTNFQCFICVHLWLNSYPGLKRTIEVSKIDN